MRANDDGIQVYLKRLGANGALTAEQNIELAYARTYPESMELAEERMLKGNLGLVGKIAGEVMKKYFDIKIDPEMLVVEGTIGLHRAIQKYSLTKINPDTGRPYAFSTYATWWITQSMERAVSGKRDSRVPEYIMDIIPRWRQAHTELKESKGYQPLPEEVFKKVNKQIESEARRKKRLLKKGEKSKARSLRSKKIGESQIPLILNALKILEGDASFVYIDEFEEPGNVFEDPESEDPSYTAFLREFNENIDAVLSRLPPEEAEALRMRYGLGGQKELTCREIAKELGLTKQCISQREGRAIKTLQEAAERGELIPRNGHLLERENQTTEPTEKYKGQLPTRRLRMNIILQLRPLDETPSILITDHGVLEREAV